MKQFSSRIFLFFLLLFFSGIYSCNKNNSASEAPGPELYPQPKSYSLNLKEGYKINPVTGDTIQPIINSFGDTVKTGVKIPTIGKMIHPDSISKPKVIKAGKGTVESAYSNRHIIPENLTIIPVDESKLEKVIVPIVAKNDTTHFVLNSIGKKVKTGVKILAKGKKVKAIQPLSKPALPMRMKDNAIYDIQFLDADQGLSSSEITCLLEDSKGNLWFGTFDRGVTKFDGHSFIHYSTKEGMNSDFILSILEDKSGNIWFGSYGGLSKFDGESFINYTENEGLMTSTVSCISEDKSGNIWFSNGIGVTKFDGKCFTNYTNNEGLKLDNINSILVDSKDNLWFGKLNQGVFKFDGKTLIQFTKKEGLSSNSIKSILEDKSGNLWFGTGGGGVTRYDGKSFIHYTDKEGLLGKSVLSILEDRDGNLWFGNYLGVSKYDPTAKLKTGSESFCHFTEKEGLSNKRISSIIEDKTGNLWFGTLGGGVSKYEGGFIQHFNPKDSLKESFVSSIYEDKRGNIWFGTYLNGVSKFDGESYLRFTQKDGLENYGIDIILEDSKGNFWFTCDWLGVTKYDGESFIYYKDTNGLTSNLVTSMLEDKFGNIWFSTNAGITKYDGKSFVHYTEKEGLSNNFVLSMLEDKYGNLWFGTNGCGVTKFDGKSFIHYSQKEGLSSNIITSIYEDKSGNLWFGTYGEGLSVFNGESFIHYIEKVGLSGSIIGTIYFNESILGDKDGNIWLCTENGINQIINTDLFNNSTKKKSTYFNHRVNTLTKLDGLKEFYFRSAFIDSKNRAWWGSSSGTNCLEMVDLNKLEYSQKTLKPFLKQIDINEQFIDYRNLSDSLKAEIVFTGIERFENYPLNLELPYDKNHLTFHFVAIDWAAPHKIKYQYILEGLEDKWNPVTDKNIADFRNLPYGTYTFKVRAIGESQIWGEPFEYTFTIHPPWWHTTWFRVCYISCFVLLLYLLFRWRTRSLRERQKQLEKTVEDRTQELKQEKEIVEEKHKEITDSINYAERIQRSFLATRETLDEHLRDYFVFFKPKDIVSGDFYWASQLKNGSFMFTVADSTGHGVPGAIMSILNISSLEKSIETEIEPHKVLNETRKIIINRLKKDGSAEGGKDGMDCSLLVLNQDKSQLTFASAHNPIIIIRKGEILEFKADKMPVGKNDKDQDSFTLHSLQLQKGDLIYTLTDGFPDQFGGEKGKKFMIKNLKNLFLSISHLPMKEQEQKLNEEFDAWKGNNEQVDDVCIIGVRI